MSFLFLQFSLLWFLLYSHLKYKNPYGRMNMKALWLLEVSSLSRQTVSAKASVNKFPSCDIKISWPWSESTAHPQIEPAAAQLLSLSYHGNLPGPRKKNVKKILIATSECVVHLILCQSSTGFLHPAESVNTGNKFCLGQQFLWLWLLFDTNLMKTVSPAKCQHCLIIFC